MSLKPTVFTRTDLVARLHQTGASGSKAQTKTIVDLVLTTITKALRRGDTVMFNDFGRFEVSEVAERSVRNPSTGEPCAIPAHRRVKFKPSRRLLAGGAE